MNPKKMQEDHIRRMRENDEEFSIERRKVLWMEDMESYFDMVSPFLINGCMRDRFGNSKIKFLDIGTGSFMAYAILNYMMNIDYHGIEVTNEIEIGEWKWNIPKEKLYRGLAEDVLETIDDKFDIVFARHVLEHIEDLDSVFNLFNSVMSEKGVMVWALPANIYDTEPAHVHKEDWKWWNKVISKRYNILYQGNHIHHGYEYYGVGEPRK